MKSPVRQNFGEGGANKLPAKFAMSELVGTPGFEPGVARSQSGYVNHYTTSRYFKN